jgi:hypothetical protein
MSCATQLEGGASRAIGRHARGTCTCFSERQRRLIDAHCRRSSDGHISEHPEQPLWGRSVQPASMQLQSSMSSVQPLGTPEVEVALGGEHHSSTG